MNILFLICLIFFTPTLALAEATPTQPLAEATPTQPLVEATPTQPLVEATPTQPLAEATPTKKSVDCTNSMFLTYGYRVLFLFFATAIWLFITKIYDYFFSFAERVTTSRFQYWAGRMVTTSLISFCSSWVIVELMLGNSFCNIGANHFKAASLGILAAL